MKKISTKIALLFLSSVIIFLSCKKNDLVAADASKTVTLETNKTAPNKATILNVAKSADYTKILLPNAQEQFGATKISVVSLGYEVSQDAKFMTIEYETEKGVHSYAMHVQVGKQPIWAGGVQLQARTEYTVDCYGSCDCRERWYPATGAIECTCNSCVMRVTQVNRVL